MTDTAKKGQRGRKRMAVYILISYVIFGIVPMVLASWLCTVLSGEYYRQVAAQELERSIENIRTELSRWVGEYAAIAKVLAGDANIISLIGAGQAMNGEAFKTLKTLCLGQERKMQLHILSIRNTLRYSTGSIPYLYTMPVYQDHGIFRMAKEHPQGYAVKATKLGTYSGAQVALTLARVICSKDGQAIGFVVIDLYRDELAALLRRFGPTGLTDAVALDDRQVVAYALQRPQWEGETMKEPRLLTLLKGQGLSRGMAPDTMEIAFAVPETGLSVIFTLSEQAISSISAITFRVTLAISIITALLAGASAFLLSKRVSRQIKRLLDTFEHTRREGLQQRYVAQESDFREIRVIGTKYNEMIGQMEQLVERMIEKQKRLNIAEVKALESQIKPHFLYNVLNDIKSLAKLGRTQEVGELVVAFGNVLRVSLDGQEEFSTVEEDVALIRDYVRMQNIRYDQTIRFLIDVQPDILHLEIPRFVLQPIVENAIIHGLGQRARRCILVKGYREEARIVFEIVDNGVGFGADVKPNSPAGASLHEGIGLENIRRRLMLYYGDTCGLSICSRKGFYTKIRVCFAAERP